MRLPFIDSDLLYRGALKLWFDYIRNHVVSTFLISNLSKEDVIKVSNHLMALVNLNVTITLHF
jgi:hypothetical protein